MSEFYELPSKPLEPEEGARSLGAAVPLGRSTGGTPHLWLASAGLSPSPVGSDALSREMGQGGAGAARLGLETA